MADFDPPFAVDNLTKRFQDALESLEGFPCGPVDRDLFNGLLFQIQSEIGNVITDAGIPHTNSRHTLLLEAIDRKITPFLRSVNSNQNGGVIQADNNRRFNLAMSDGTVFRLQLPDLPSAPPPQEETFTCTNVQLRDLSVTPNSFSRGNFTFTEFNQFAVQSAGAFPLTVSIDNPGIVILPETANRFRLGTANPGQQDFGRVTITAAPNRLIGDIVLSVFDVDFPTENLTSWSALPQTISPAFANTVESFVTIRNINSNTLSFNYQSISESIVIYVQSLLEGVPTFTAQRCVSNLGDIEFRNLSGDPISGNFEVVS